MFSPDSLKDVVELLHNEIFVADAHARACRNAIVVYSPRPRPHRVTDALSVKEEKLRLLEMLLDSHNASLILTAYTYVLST